MEYWSSAKKHHTFNHHSNTPVLQYSGILSLQYSNILLSIESATGKCATADPAIPARRK
jgi:hypothetical protein